MKAIILTMSTGSGHNIASGAIKEYLVSKGVDATVIDAYKYFNKKLSFLIEKGYVWSAKYVPYMYGKFYNGIEKHNPDSRMAWSSFCNSIVARQFARYISRQNPDVVIPTHPLAAVLMSSYKEKKLVNTKTIGIVTDFCILPYWDMANMDYYTTANDLVMNMLIKKGISKEKILPYGIPIDSRFSQKKEKSEARKLLGIEDKKTIFVISGSMGFGNTEKYIRALDGMKEDFQIVNVCGSNEHMKNRIDNLYTRKKLYNFGFVNNVDLIMDASDILITKPGGLTVSEALAKNVPMILVDPIPGQEDRNRDFLINIGVATGISKHMTIDEAVSQLLTIPGRMEQIKEMQKIFARPDSSKLIGDFVINFAEKER